MDEEMKADFEKAEAACDEADKGLKQMLNRMRGQGMFDVILAIGLETFYIWLYWGTHLETINIVLFCMGTFMSGVLMWMGAFMWRHGGELYERGKQNVMSVRDVIERTKGIIAWFDRLDSL